MQSQANALRAQTEALQSQKEALQIQIQELESIRRNLEHTVAVYKRCLFGSRSEKIDPKELEARIAQAAAEAREQLAKEKRPGDPPPEAEEEKPEAKAAADKPADQEKKRKARPHGRRRFSSPFAASTDRAPHRSRSGRLRVLCGSSALNPGGGGYL